MFLLLACTGTAPEGEPRTNNAPAIAELRLEPEAPYGTDDITAVTAVVDLDGDETTLGYTWSVDGVEQAIDVDALPSGTARRDQLVHVEVTISDGFSFGTPVEAEVVLLNAAPTISSVTIDPSSPQVGDPLACVGETVEPDGDELTSTWSWTVDGVDAANETDLLEAELPRNTEVACSLTVADDEHTSDTLWSEAVFVGNSPPGSPLIKLVPNPPTSCTGGEVEILAEAEDPDGDELTYDVTWEDTDGNEVWGEFAYPGETFEPGGSYSVSVWADDGFFQGEPTTLEFTAVSGGETIGNGIDDDCDGVVDEWIEDAWQGQQLWWDTTESAQAGFTLGTGDLDGDTLDDVILSRSGENDLLVFLGASMDPAVVVLGDPDLEIDEAQATNALAFGDTDGDGLDDMLVASPGDDTVALDAGAVHLVLAKDLADGDLDALSSWTLYGEEATHRMSGSIALGDLDGDGVDDIAVGDPDADAPARESGRILVFTDLSGGAVDPDDADVLYEGGVREGLFGTSVAIVDDIDGDGISELVGGAPETDPDGTDSGTVAVWFGGTLGGGYVSAADVRVYGTASDAFLGREPAGAGDIDGDGLAELAVGSEEDAAGLNMPGTLSLFLGSDLAAGGEWTLDDAFATVQADTDDAWLGLYGVGPLVGDTDGSGSADLVAGAAGEQAIYLWRGMDLVAGGDFTTGDASIRIGAEAEDDYFGRWALLADTDGDGIQDLLSSAWRESTYADRAGALYVFRPPFGQEAEAWEPDCQADGALLFCRTPTTWTQARAHCQTLATDLAVVDSSSWNLIASESGASLYPAGIDRGEWWIGLSDAGTEGTWVWLDETTATTFTAWGSTPGEDDTRNCAVMNEPGLGEWDDRPCELERFFICR
ncbi:MAG: hypothetical protein GY913_18040 [Proteobacteria bacterium]|nr:hypothetical protein [Pseudomonadota bacterium]MCP4918809.1 hypothetical protein [Pseudomonadota bacterium]